MGDMVRVLNCKTVVRTLANFDHSISNIPARINPASDLTHAWGAVVKPLNNGETEHYQFVVGFRNELDKEVLREASVFS